MYLWLCVVVFVAWLWLTGGSFTAWRGRRLGGGLTTLSILAWTGIAALVLLFVGPYWHVVFQVAGQPG